MQTAPRPKPKHLGPAYGAQFQDASIARAYKHRAPYAPETIGVLLDLVPDPADALVLDAGCGSGDLARLLAPRVARVDAVDPSSALLSVGRSLEDGDHPALHWIEAPIEVAPLDGPYGLITAGESVHWMDWDVVFERFAAWLAPDAWLAVIERFEAPPPWRAELQLLIEKHSTNPDYEKYDIFDELASRGLFVAEGRHATRPITVTQPVEDYIESMHSRNGFSRERMGEDAQVFDGAYAALLARHGIAGEVTYAAWDTIVWGRPNP